MNVLFMTLMYPQELLPVVSRNAKDGLQNQINSYQRAFVEGISQNLKATEQLEIVNALPVGVFPTRYRKPIIPKGTYDGCIHELGCINLPYLKQRGRKRRAMKALLAWVQANPDNRTILLYTLYLPFMQAIATVKKQYPDLRACVIVTDLPNELGIASYRHGLWKRMEYAMGDHRIQLCDAFDGFVLLTKHMAEALPLQAKKWMVMEGLILQSDTNLLVQTEHQNVPAVLYTGTLNRELGIAELLQAFEELPECELWLCGKGDMEAAIKAASAQYPNIRYFGFVAHEEALQMQAKATLLVNPRTAAGVFTRYSFPSKTLEYMRSGKPVLCYKLDGIPKDYDPYLFYIEGTGAQGIKGSIQRLLQMPAQELCARGQAAKKYVFENKNPNIQCARLISFLHEL
ncbi:MAG: glycosyltransferase [Clostridia bacterium]